MNGLLYVVTGGVALAFFVLAAFLAWLVAREKGSRSTRLVLAIAALLATLPPIIAAVTAVKA